MDSNPKKLAEKITYNPNKTARSKIIKSKFVREVCEDSDGKWVYLKKGYSWDGEGHTIHEDTWERCLSQLSDVIKCDCESCTTSSFLGDGAK